MLRRSAGGPAVERRVAASGPASARRRQADAVLIRYSAILRATVLRCRPSSVGRVADAALGALQRARDEQLLELAPGVVVEDALVEHLRNEPLQLIAHGRYCSSRPDRRRNASTYLSRVRRDHVVGQRRHRRLLVPAGSLRGSRGRTACRSSGWPCPGWYCVLRPEARRVRRQHFVDQDHVGGRIAVADQAELELGVGDDDALATRRARTPRAIDLERQLPSARCDQRRGRSIFAASLLADVLVVAALGLGRRREDRLGQAVGLAQARPAARCRRRCRSAGIPSSPIPTGSRARRTRSAAAACAARASSGRAARRACGCERGRDTRRRRSRSRGAAPGRPCARTRTPTAASAPCPCRECPSRARSRTPRCDRWRRCSSWSPTS